MAASGVENERIIFIIPRENVRINEDIYHTLKASMAEKLRQINSSFQKLQPGVCLLRIEK
jgi:hypothetical protein